MNATVNDAPIISLLGRITFSETFEKDFTSKKELLEYLDTTFSTTKISGSLAKTQNIYWIAFYNDLPIGYAKLKLNSSCSFTDEINICQLQKIYVLKDFISKGVGKLLNEALIQKAINMKYKYIWLAVLESNLTAINFYERQSYLKIGENTFQIGTQKFQFNIMGRNL